MIAKGGSALLKDDAVFALKSRIVNKSYLVTPNIPEAEVLSGMKIANTNDMKLAAEKILAEKISGENNCYSVLIKGGHLSSDEFCDIMLTRDGKFLELKTQKIPTKNTHGTGCTYASAISALLAKGNSLENSIKTAHSYVQNAIINAPNIGKGHGPLMHKI